MTGLEPFLLFIAGCFIGTFAMVVGGAMFFSVPLMQALFPGLSFGAIVGNIKVGSFFTAAGTVYATRHDIAWRGNIKLAALAFVGSVAGASLIAQLDQRWLLMAVVAAIAVSLLAPKIARFVTPKTFHAASFLTGLYAGLFGAGIGLVLLALLRIHYPADTQIAYAKIQARFIEMLLVIAAIVTHFIHGNLIASIFIPWAAGGLCGGLIGGLLLKKMGRLSGPLQRKILYVSFAVALIVALTKFFQPA